MPRRDGTGPMGTGPINGVCINNSNNSNLRIKRRGFNFGFKQDYSSITKEDLLEEKNFLETRLKEIEEILK